MLQFLSHMVLFLKRTILFYETKSFYFCFISKTTAILGSIEIFIFSHFKFYSKEIIHPGDFRYGGMYLLIPKNLLVKVTANIATEHKIFRLSECFYRLNSKKLLGLQWMYLMFQRNLILNT